jgi:hypothetical protein
MPCLLNEKESHRLTGLSLVRMKGLSLSFRSLLHLTMLEAKLLRVASFRESSRSQAHF